MPTGDSEVWRGSGECEDLSLFIGEKVGRNGGGTE